MHTTSPQPTALPIPADLAIHARWIAPVVPECVLDNHAVVIVAGRIIDILPSPAVAERYAATETVHLEHHLLLPGLVNAHTHAAMSLMRGLADDHTLMVWLKEHIWPVEARHVSHPFVHDGTLLACAEMLKSGITCFNDMYFFPEAAAEAVTRTGMRAVLGMTVLDFPSAYASGADEYLDKGMAAFEQWAHHPLLRFAMAPHAPYSVCDTTLGKVQRLADRLQLPVHTHLHETEAEIAEHLAVHGCRPLARFEALGLLNTRLIGVHAVYLEDYELDCLHNHHVSVVHCPSSNLKLASGIAPVASLLDHEVNVALGTDGAASNNRLDILTETRLASLLAKGSSKNPVAVRAYQALRMATLNGAHALGLDVEIGSIETGKLADLCAVRMDALQTQPCFDPVSHLVYCVEREQITHVWVNGKCCVFDKTLAGTSEADLKKTVRVWQNRLGSA